MKTGIELIAIERQEQLIKHGYDAKNDSQYKDLQFSIAAVKLLNQKLIDVDMIESPPIGWDINIWMHMIRKSYNERLIIAGALIAAEIDRLNKEA